MKKTVLDYALKIRLPITIFVILTAYALTYFISRPERDGLGYAPEQPINYSHKLHAGEMNIDCQYCHTDVEKGRHAGIPSTDICMNCHSLVNKDSLEIKKLTKFFDEGKQVPWKRVHKVPDYAYFNHSVHVNKGIKCESCHGNVSSMEKVAQVHSFTMANCLRCHRNAKEMLPYIKDVKNGPDNCNACHR